MVGMHGNALALVMDMGAHASVDGVEKMKNSAKNRENTNTSPQLSPREWKKLVAEFQNPHIVRAVWQMLNTLLPILAIWITLYFLKDISIWSTPTCDILTNLSWGR